MRKLLACSIVGLLSLNGTVALHAQTAPKPANRDDERVALQEFVVSESADATGYAATSTGAVTRTNTALIDTPTIVNVVTRAFLEDVQASELYDALKYVPGISIESNVGDSVMMRGYTVRSQFTDGLYDNQNQSQLGAEPYQFERVEILKGPSALVYGSTALGGLVNRVRKSPKFKAEGQIGLTVGSYGQHKVEIDYTAPINDKLAYRIVGVYRDDGDTVQGVNVDWAYARRWNLNPTLLWKPSDTTQVKVIGEFMTEKYFKHWGENAMYSNGAYDPNSKLNGTFLSYPSGTETTNGLRWEQGGNTTVGVLPRTWTWSEEDAFVANHKQAGILSLETQITPEWSMRTIGQAHWWDHMALDYIPSAMQRNNEWMTRAWRPIANDDFTATFAIDSVYNFNLLGGEHKALAIMQTQYESNWYPIWGAGFIPGTTTPEDMPAMNLYNPVHTGAFVPKYGTRYTQNTYSNRYNYGFAAQDHAKFMDEKLQLVGGARWDWFASQTKNYLLTSNQNGNRNADGQWTYKYGVVVKPTKAYSLFFNHSETYNPNFGTQPDGTDFDHQRGKIDEVGVKSALLDGRIAGSISAYTLRLENIVSGDPDPIRALAGWRVLTAFQEVKGYEVDLFLTVTPNWQVNLGTGQLEMKIPVGTGQAALHGHNLRPRGLPTETYNIWTRYDFRTGPLKGFAFGGGANYRSSSPVDALNLFYRPGVTTMDAFAQYAWRAYRIQLNVSNLTDETYIARTVNPPQLFNGAYRAVKLRVSRKF